MSDRRPLRVIVIAPLRFPIRAPHAGGLESAVWSEVRALRGRGHQVSLIAVRGSDFVAAGSAFEMPELAWPDGAVRTDDSYPRSYEAISVPALDRALDEIEATPGRYDVISNHCLHPLPIRRAAGLGVPMLTTLHTPPDATFVAAYAAAGSAGSAFVSVSEYTRRVWARAGIPSELLANGVDPRAWPEGPGGEDLVWFGRIVPEKAPHLAVAVARRAGRRLTIAGRVGDRSYAESALFPLLGDGVEYVGPLSPRGLSDLVGRSAAGIATPAWDEPFGLVAPEALMCGTPFVSFAVGGVPELARRSVGMEMVASGDVPGMAERVSELIGRTRTDPTFRRCIRAAAIRRFSLEERTGSLERVFAHLVDGASRGEELSA